MSKSKIENNYDCEGKVLFVGQPDPISPTFNVRIVVIEMYKGRYMQKVPFQFINRNMSLLDDVETGDHVIINFQLGGRENKHKPEWYSSLEGRSIHVI